MKVGLSLVLMTLIAGTGCVPPAPEPAPKPKPHDLNVQMAMVFGLQMGMSPRRVKEEIQRKNWTYSRTSRDTVDDLIEQRPSMGTLYLELPKRGDGSITSMMDTNSLEVGFAWDSVYTKQLRVNHLCHTEGKPASEYEAVVAAAKAHLNSLGGFTESITNGIQFEHRLTYSKSRILVYYTVTSY